MSELKPADIEQLGLQLIQMADDMRAAHSTAKRGGVGKKDLGEIARWLYAIRRKRTVFFQSALFAEPAWDILLDLFIGWSENRDINIKSLAIASNVPHPTALRWLATLEKAGLIYRQPAPLDARSQHVQFTPEGLHEMRRYLSTVAAER